MIDLDLSSDIEKAVDAFAATRVQAKKAGTRAARKTMRAGAREIKRAVSRKTRVPQKSLNARTVLRFGNDRYDKKMSLKERSALPKVGAEEIGGAHLWMGLDPVPVHLLGTPRQQKKALKIGRQTRRGAFIADMGKGERVFVRLSSSYYSKPLYSGVYGATAKGLLPDSFPITMATVDVDQAGGRAGEAFSYRAKDLFLKHFDHELNYEVNVK